MFNRTLQVKMVKPEKEAQKSQNQPDLTLEGKCAHVCYYLERAGTKLAKAALTYAVVDTIRQVVIAKATK